MKSIMQTEKECYVCGSRYNIHEHHCLYGTANRKQSEKYGLKVFLCMEHHVGRAGVHSNKPLDLHLKKLAQAKFETEYGDRNEFRRVFGKSYL